MFLSQHITGDVFSYGLFILETVVALGVIAGTGYLVVRFSKKKMLLGTKNGRMRLIERLPLEQKRALHLVEVDGRPFLIGTSEQAVQLITPLDSAAPPKNSAIDNAEGDA